MELDNLFAGKATQYPIDVNPSQTCRVANVLLGQGEMHFLRATGWPHHAVTNKEL